MTVETCACATSEKSRVEATPRACCCGETCRCLDCACRACACADGCACAACPCA